MIAPAFVLGLLLTQATPSLSEYERFAPGQPKSQQGFGHTTAIQGNTFMVADGAFEDRVHVYQRSGASWVSSFQIVPPPGAPVAALGTALAFDGDTLVAADLANQNANGSGAGAVFVYVRSGSTWQFQQFLIASNGTQDDEFGRDVALDGDTLVVGAHEANGAVFLGGSAYVFERVGSVWSETAILNPSIGAFMAHFGRSVAMDGDTIAIGAPTDEGAAVSDGVVYVFCRSGDQWVEEARLFDPAAIGGEFFGTGLSLDGDRLAIGLIGDKELDLIAPSGAVWIYERSGTTWSPVQKLHASDAKPQGGFGNEIVLSGDTLVTSGYVSSPGPHQVYHFQRDPSGWTEVARLVNSDFMPNDAFAENIAFDGGNVVVTGAPGAVEQGVTSGAVYVHVIDVPPVVYCTGKPNSQGCVPKLATSGEPTLSSSDADFLVLARDVLPSKPGLFFYGLGGPTNLPFLGGTLCVVPPLARTPVLLASPGTGCDGGYAFLASQAFFASAGLDPGETVHGQFWMRDPDHADGTGVGLSNAVEFSVQP